MVNMYTHNPPVLYIDTFFIILENIDGVMHLYVACGMAALDILSLTSELPSFCLIGTMVGLFHLYGCYPRSGI